MDDEAAAALKDAIIRECVALGALALILFAMGPGRVLVPAWISRVRGLWSDRDPHEAAVRQFAREVSIYEHEQASKAHRGPAGRGPCGCGGLRAPVGHSCHSHGDAAGGDSLPVGHDGG